MYASASDTPFGLTMLSCVLWVWSLMIGRTGESSFIQIGVRCSQLSFYTRDFDKPQCVAGPYANRAIPPTGIVQ